MGSSSERNQLLQLFNSHKKDIYEAFEVYEKPSDPTLVKLSWDKVLEMGDAISRQATIVGMIWTGEPPVYEEVEENMAAYVNTLNGFLLIAYGASIGAGPTLLNSIRSSVKKILDTSFSIMKESIASFGACSENDRTIPQLTGQVWEACSELERTPNTNIAAIGRRITKVAVSVKDVLRELSDLKSGPAKEISESESESDGGADLGNDLSPEEMRVAKEAISTVSKILSLIKEILRAITAQKSRGDEPIFVESLEKILNECRVWEPSLDELGACLYPPQEIEAIKAALEKISVSVGNVESEIESLFAGGGASEGFRRSCGDLKESISRFRAELERSEEVESK